MADTVPLNAEHLAAYFALMEVGSLLQHAVEQQLRTDGGLSYVQFQILARLHDAPAGVSLGRAEVRSSVLIRGRRRRRVTGIAMPRQESG